jgi:PAS domain S-box-containing protein
MRPRLPTIAKLDLGRSPWTVRYGAATVFVLLALLLNLLPPVQPLPFLFFFAAVTLTARFCGFRPAWFATALSAAAADFFLMTPRYTFTRSWDDLLRVLFFALVSLLISSIARAKSAAELVAEQERTQLAAIVESSEDAIYSKQLDGTITSWNKGAENIFGYAAGEIVGKNVAILARPERENEVRDILKRLSRGEKIEHYETERLKKAGSRIDVSLSISPLYDAEGNTIGASSIARDITARKLSEQALRRAEQLAMAGRLSATVAHELNNPLESLTNLLYLLRHNKSLDDAARKQLELADHELARAAHMARQTLGFYRDSSSPVRADIAHIMDEVLELYMRKLESKHIEVERRYATPMAVPVLPGEIRQLFSNLIANAIDAIDSPGRIAVRIKKSGEWKNSRVRGVRVTIADSGSGINPAARQRIFEAFYTTKKEVGTGLGLWLSREVAHKHGGSISVRSSTGPQRSGTVFSVFLPLEPDP